MAATIRLKARCMRIAIDGAEQSYNLISNPSFKDLQIRNRSAVGELKSP